VFASSDAKAFEPAALQNIGNIALADTQAIKIGKPFLNVANRILFTIVFIFPVDEERPGAQLKKMRDAGAKDIDVTFRGMAFIIQSAVQLIGDAMKTITSLENPV
jgi:hypothetical protein